MFATSAFVDVAKETPKGGALPPTDLQAWSIGPEEAEFLLTFNTRNRRLRPAKLATYIADMRAGLWQPSGDAIEVACMPDGTQILLNGQHRLQAVLQTGMAQDFHLWFRPCRDEEELRRFYDVIDQGGVRTMQDTYTADGADRRRAAAQALAARTIAVAALLIPEGVTAFTQLTTSRTRALAATCPQDTAWLTNLCLDRPGPMLAFPLGFLTGALYAHRQRPALADAFFRQVVFGEHLESGQPAYLLRQSLLNRSATRTTRYSTTKGVRSSTDQHIYWYGCVLACWWHELQGRVAMQMIRPIVAPRLRELHMPSLLAAR